MASKQKAGTGWGSALWMSLALYASLILGLSIWALVAQAGLSGAKLGGVVHSLQSIKAEKRDLAELVRAHKLTLRFATAEIGNAVKMAKELQQEATKIDTEGDDSRTRALASALAKEIIQENEPKSPSP
jgi:biopolymer transport protein ExbB/TolQ